LVNRLCYSSAVNLFFLCDRQQHRSRSTDKRVSRSTTTSPLIAVSSSASTFCSTVLTCRYTSTASSPPEYLNRRLSDYDPTPPSYTSHYVSSRLHPQKQSFYSLVNNYSVNTPHTLKCQPRLQFFMWLLGVVVTRWSRST